MFRGVDFKKVAEITSARGECDVVLLMKDASRVVIEGYPGEGLWDRCTTELNVANRRTAPDFSTLVEALVASLEAVVNFNEADPDLYDGDEDGTLGRIMFAANEALEKARRAAPWTR